MENIKDFKLIPLIDFVLERGFLSMKYSGLQIRKYAFFLKEPLTLGSFYPCDEEGNYLVKPRKDDFSFYAHKNQSVQEEYIEAKNKILFDHKLPLFKVKEILQNYKTIESLTFHKSLKPLKLSEFALKQIFD